MGSPLCRETRTRSEPRLVPTRVVTRNRSFTVSRRIGGETEPLNLATETNTGRGVYPTRDPQSPVRRRKGSTAKPRGIPEISQAVPEFAGEVSAAAD